MQNVNDLLGQLIHLKNTKRITHFIYLDAAERLMKCDTCFVKVYGNSFQRLKALQKDGMGHMVLFVRLHLLQVKKGNIYLE
jgi:hypothetical protein